MGAWGVTFPLGSLALLTFSLGNSFDSLFFKYVLSYIISTLPNVSLCSCRVIGTGMTLIVFTMWWLVAIPTARGFLRGTLFEAPCLSALPEDYGRKIVDRRRNIHGDEAKENVAVVDEGGAADREEDGREATVTNHEDPQNLGAARGQDLDLELQ